MRQLFHDGEPFLPGDQRFTLTLSPSQFRYPAVRFSLRDPRLAADGSLSQPIMTPIVCLIAAYPSGKFLAWALPITTWTPPAWTGYDGDISLNPGPFNIKEHTVVLLMSNVAISPVYALHFSVACEKFYKIKFGAGFDILAAVTSQTIGFAVAGLCRRFLVWPASLLWPQNLALSTLLNTLHAEEDNEAGAGISRHQFFCWAFVGAFAWNFLPGELAKYRRRDLS